MELRRTEEFEAWLLSLSAKTQHQVVSRLERIENFGHFGDHRSLGNGLHELKFKNGNRIYFAYEAVTRIVVILGGNKNGQSKDIAKARKAIEKL